MIEEFISQIQLAIADGLTGLFGPVFAWMYLIEWYVFGGTIILVCFTIGFFFPFQWIRAGLGWVVTLVISAIWAATVVYRKMRQGS